MKTAKMYFYSIVANFIPLLSLFLFMLLVNWDLQGIFRYNDATYILHDFYLPFFVISLLLNLSFFLLKFKFFRDKKAGRFIAYYLSSIVFFIISTWCFCKNYVKLYISFFM